MPARWIAWMLLLVPGLAHAAPVPLSQVFADRGSAPAAPVEFTFSAPLQHATAIPTGRQREPEPGLAALVNQWARVRGLGPDYLTLGLHPHLVELQDGGASVWVLVGFPASVSMERFVAGRSVDLVVQRIGFVRGQPAVLVFHAGTRAEAAAALAPGSPVGALFAAPLRVDVVPFRRGEARFTFGGRTLRPPTRDPALQRTEWTVYKDVDGSALSLAFGETAPPIVQLRLGGLKRPGTYTDYRSFFGSVQLAGGVHVSIDPKELRDCQLALARLDAGGAEGTLRCRHAPGVNELVPTEWEFRVAP